MTAIISFLIAGFFLLLAEIFLPGLIAGICGLVCLAAATVLVFIHYGAAPGIYLSMGLIVFGLAGFLVWMKFYPKTRFGKKFTLPEKTNESPLPPSFFQLLHQEGTALTTLRPGGTIDIQGRRYDAVSEGQFIDSGDAIRIVKLDGQIIVVRKLQQT